jgi:YfiR/HmsC-like
VDALRRPGWAGASAYPTLLLCLFLLALTPSLRAVEASPPSEYQIKAAFLLNFTKFIEWPASEAAGSTFSICVLGEDPFGPVLDQLVEGETVGGRKIAVRRIRAEAAGSCEILYVSKLEQNFQAALAGVGAGVLTVGEGDGFLDGGGMIAFILEDRRVRFNIDQGAAQKAGLKLSSRLLSVARSVR